MNPQNKTEICEWCGANLDENGQCWTINHNPKFKPKMLEQTEPKLIEVKSFEGYDWVWETPEGKRYFIEQTENQSQESNTSIGKGVVTPVSMKPDTRKGIFDTTDLEEKQRFIPDSKIDWLALEVQIKESQRLKAEVERVFALMLEETTEIYGDNIETAWFYDLVNKQKTRLGI